MLSRFDRLRNLSKRNVFLDETIYVNNELPTNNEEIENVTDDNEQWVQIQITKCDDPDSEFPDLYTDLYTITVVSNYPLTMVTPDSFSRAISQNFSYLLNHFVKKVCEIIDDVVVPLRCSCRGCKVLSYRTLYEIGTMSDDTEFTLDELAEIVGSLEACFSRACKHKTETPNKKAVKLLRDFIQNFETAFQKLLLIMTDLNLTETNIVLFPIIYKKLIIDSMDLQN